MKTAMFFNGDYHKQDPLLFKDVFNMPFSQISGIWYDTHANYRQNTGTFLFTDALAKNLDAEWIARDGISYLENAHDVETVVTTLLHSVGPVLTFDYDYWKRLLKTGKRIVPLSAGFFIEKWAEVGMQREIAEIFSEMSERAEIGVRGEYSADILNKMGVKNVRVIGCPSLFYHMDREFTVRKNDKGRIESLNINFTPFSARIAGKTKRIAEWFLKIWGSSNIDVHTTLQEHFLAVCATLETYQYGFDIYKANFYLSEFINATGRWFFDVESWSRAVGKNDFSIGTKFHGNTAAVVGTTPALYLIPDLRAEEMCRFFKLPFIKAQDFDETKDIRYYYEKADYAEFNKNYKAAFDNFTDYCEKNGVTVK